MPCEYRGHPNSRDIAESHFLKALRQEKARGPAVPPRAPRPDGRASLRPPRVHGQAFGHAFAQVSQAHYDQAASYARAIRSGVQEARQLENEARESAQDSDTLRALGFTGRDDDED
jgi:hypothetical protein